MSNEDKTIWVTFNGEIYNFKELRKILEGTGHQFRSQTDTEVVIHGYEEWGVDCVDHLRGMFAFGVSGTAGRNGSFWPVTLLALNHSTITRIRSTLFLPQNSKQLLHAAMCRGRLLSVPSVISSITATFRHRRVSGRIFTSCRRHPHWCIRTGERSSGSTGHLPLIRRGPVTKNRP